LIGRGEIGMSMKMICDWNLIILERGSNEADSELGFGGLPRSQGTGRDGAQKSPANVPHVDKKGQITRRL